VLWMSRKEDGATHLVNALAVARTFLQPNCGARHRLHSINSLVVGQFSPNGSCQTFTLEP
jgi:hypothetical protein